MLTLLLINFKLFWRAAVSPGVFVFVIFSGEHTCFIVFFKKHCFTSSTDRNKMIVMIQRLSVFTCVIAGEKRSI